MLGLLRESYTFPKWPEHEKGSVRFMKLNDVRLHPECYLAPNCTVIGSVSVGRYSSLFPGVAIRADRDRVVIGSNTNVQENAIIHVEEGFPCMIGDNVTIGHGAIVHACTVKNNSIVGMGSIVMDGAVVGENCLIGSGAVISKGVVIPDNSVVMGLPGKVKRTISDEEIAYNRESADMYAENARQLVAAGFFFTGDTLPRDIRTITRAQACPSAE